MRDRRVQIIVLALLVVGALSGCGGASTGEPATPTDDAPVVSDAATFPVVAEAVIEPARWSELYFDTAGTVDAVLVQEGNVVAQGDMLILLDATLLELGLQSARLELESAEMQYRQQLAEATLDLQTAEARLSQARARFPDLTEAEIALQHAVEEEQDAAREYAQAQGREEWHIDQVRKAYTDRWERAQEELAIAQASYDAIWGERYAQTQELAILEKGVEQARLRLEQVEQGQPVEAARLQVAQAEQELAAATLVAPFGGTVAVVDVRPGDAVTPGEMVLVLATLQDLQAHTIDLTELDVVRVRVGQPASVTIDALPELILSGRVAHIDLRYVTYRGDVTYPIIVELEEAGQGLRWGMTAVVEIAPE